MLSFDVMADQDNQSINRFIFFSPIEFLIMNYVVGCSQRCFGQGALLPDGGDDRATGQQPETAMHVGHAQLRFERFGAQPSGSGQSTRIDSRYSRIEIQSFHGRPQYGRPARHRRIYRHTRHVWIRRSQGTTQTSCR